MMTMKGCSSLSKERGHSFLNSQWQHLEIIRNRCHQKTQNEVMWLKQPFHSERDCIRRNAKEISIPVCIELTILKG